MWALNVKALIIYLLDLVRPQQPPQLLRWKQRQARNGQPGRFQSRRWHPGRDRPWPRSLRSHRLSRQLIVSIVDQYQVHDFWRSPSP